MVGFALLHGGGSSAWDWHLVAALLQDAGHDCVAVDLPIEDDDAGLEDYALAVVDAVGLHSDIIVVGHSLGGFTAPLAAEALGASGLVFLAGMIPLPGESFEEWWANTGHDQESIPDDPADSFFNDVPEGLAREAVAHERHQRGSWMSRPWPGEAQPNIPTAAILCRDDAFFPPEFMRRQVRDRLGVEPIEIAGGHYAALSNPGGVARSLIDFAAALKLTGDAPA